MSRENYVCVESIYGVSENELYAEWRETADGATLADWLAAQYRELGELNPLGGWDAESAPDFAALADQIKRNA